MSSVTNQNSQTSSSYCSSSIQVIPVKNLGKKGRITSSASVKHPPSLPHSAISRIQDFTGDDNPPLSLVSKDWREKSFLHWTQRPREIQKKIDMAYRAVFADTSSSWGLFNGMEKYGLFDIDEHALALKLIQQAPSTQKSHTFVDWGAGNFQWSQSLADCINRSKDIPSDSRESLSSD